jgi:hypothetical protein
MNSASKAAPVDPRMVASVINVPDEDRCSARRTSAVAPSSTMIARVGGGERVEQRQPVAQPDHHIGLSSNMNATVPNG